MFVGKCCVVDVRTKERRFCGKIISTNAQSKCFKAVHNKKIRYIAPQITHSCPLVFETFAKYNILCRRIFLTASNFAVRGCNETTGYSDVTHIYLYIHTCNFLDVTNNYTQIVLRHDLGIN